MQQAASKIREIELFAKENKIPIIEKEGKDFLIKYLNENKVINVLEIGSAIGYSAIMMALVSEKINIVTIERDEIRFKLALKYISELNLKDQITIINEDALVFDEKKLTKKFDLLFIDAAKAQYQKFLEKYLKCLEENGSIIVDNINFHGFVSGERKTNNRNTKQLVGKIRRFREWIMNNENFHVEFQNIGDGIMVIRKI